MINQNEQEAVDRAIQDPEFQRLLSGYREYERTEPSAKNPIVHGTGSYALKRIIRDGFVPQKMVLAGEKSHYFVNSEVNPICFTVPENGGEKFSHWYADLAAKDNQLAFDADRYLKPRLVRIIEGIAGDIDGYVNSEALKEIQNIPEDDFSMGRGLILEMTKAEIRKEVEWKIADRGRRAANVFDPEIAKEDVKKMEKLLRGEDGNIETVEETLRKQALLDEIRFYYAPRGEKLPKYRTSEMICWVVGDLKNEPGNPRDLVIKAIQEKIQLLKRKIAEYNALSLEERLEIENQFPCYVVVESEGIEGEITERPEEAGGRLGGKLIELWSHNRIPPERIREVQVPESKIPEVESWFGEAGISGVRIVPFEYFEMKEILKKARKKD